MALVCVAISFFASAHSFADDDLLKYWNFKSVDESFYGFRSPAADEFVSLGRCESWAPGRYGDHLVYFSNPIFDSEILDDPRSIIDSVFRDTVRGSYLRENDANT